MLSSLSSRVANLFRSSTRRRRQASSLRGTDQLEARQLLTVVFMDHSDGSLLIGGTQGDDAIQITQENDDTVTIQEMNEQGNWVSESTHSGVTRIVVIAGAGNDYIFNDTDIVSVMHGEEGDDDLRGGTAADVLIGGLGDDLLYGSDGDDVLIGAAQDDDLFGGDGDDFLFGGWGRDVLYGESGDDNLFGLYAPEDSAASLVSDEWASYVGDYSLTDSGDADSQIQLADGNREQYTFSEVISPELQYEIGAIGDDPDSAPLQSYLQYVLQIHVTDVVSGGAGDDYADAGRHHSVHGFHQIASYLQGDDGADELRNSGGWGTLAVLDGGDNNSNWNPPSDVSPQTVHDEFELDGSDKLLQTGWAAGLLFGGSGSDYISSTGGDSMALGGDGADLIVAADLLSDATTPAYELTAHGGNGDDVIIGGAFADELHGGPDDDIIFGGDSDDRILGNEGNDLIHGQDGDDDLYGDGWFQGLPGDYAGGDDTIMGGLGADWIENHMGNDTVDAGADNDQIRGTSYQQVDHGTGIPDFNGVIPDLHMEGQRLVISGQETRDRIDITQEDSTTVTVTYRDLYDQAAFVYEFQNVQQIFVNAGGGNDTIRNQTNIPSHIIGGQGHDHLEGGSAGDILEGGDGADSIYGNDGADEITGGPGNDSLYAGSNGFSATADEINAMLDGSLDPTGLVDLVAGGDGMDNLYGGPGTDLLAGGRDFDFIDGAGGSDILIADDIFSSLATGERPENSLWDNHLLAGSGDDVVIGGAGRDLISGEDGNDMIDGRSGNDHIRGDDGNDLIYGGNGDDILLAGKGNDIIHGGAGNDDIYAEIREADDPQSINQLFGDDGHDLLIALSTNNELHGGAGDDWIEGLQTNTASGGDGIDYMNVTNQLDENELDDAVTQLREEEGSDPAEYWRTNRDATFGSPGEIIQAMQTTLNGSSSDDKSAAGATVTNGVLTVTLDNSGQHVELHQTRTGVNLIYFDANGRATRKELFEKVTSLDIRGGKGNDRIVNKTDLNATIHGGAGDDVLIGGSGRDVIYGGSGRDVLQGNGGRDSLFE